MVPYLSVAAIKKRLIILPFLFICVTTLGQLSITGAQCVLPGMIYQYNIKGNWKPNDKISICVDGGLLTESGTSCIYNQQSVSYVRLQWNGKNTGKITVTSQSGTSNLSVSITSPLIPVLFKRQTSRQSVIIKHLLRYPARRQAEALVLPHFLTSGSSLRINCTGQRSPVPQVGIYHLIPRCRKLLFSEERLLKANLKLQDIPMKSRYLFFRKSRSNKPFSEPLLQTIHNAYAT